MPNEFITPEQVVEDMLETSRRHVEKMPFSQCSEIWDAAVDTFDQGFAPGINSAALVSVLIACRERVERQPGVPEGAD